MTDEEQQRRRLWFREHWVDGVAFNRRCNMRIVSWDEEAVEIALPYANDLSAHDGIFHGGVVAALLDTTATAAVIAGHDFSRGSRLTTISMSVQYLSVAPGEDLLCEGRVHPSWAHGQLRSGDREGSDVRQAGRQLPGGGQHRRRAARGPVESSSEVA